MKNTLKGTLTEENLLKAVSMEVAERSRFSILWQYHARGRKTYDKL